MKPKKTVSPHRHMTRPRVVAGSIVVATLSLAGAGAAMATPILDAFGISHAVDPIDPAPAPAAEEETPLPYTTEQFDALSSSEYTYEDIEGLAALWNVDELQAKALAGQMLLDGKTLPLAPGEAGGLTPADPDPDEGWEGWEGEYTDEQYEAYFDAGYTYEDGLALGELWGLDYVEVKTRAGQTLINGKTLPIEPGSTTPEDVAGLEY